MRERGGRESAFTLGTRVNAVIGRRTETGERDPSARSARESRPRETRRSPSRLVASCMYIYVCMYIGAVESW